MLKKALETIEKYKMLKNGDKIICGLSGGADSVALLSILCRLRKKYDLTVTGVHVNHGIRGKEADEDCDFCKKLCESMDVDIIVRNFDIPQVAKELGLGSEEAGRNVRYTAFEEARKSINADKIAVAHNLNDEAETVIMRLCRGTGIKGLCGILPVRDNIIRPLINCSREEIEKYVSEEGLEFRTDSTNLEDEYARNRIRHNVLPVLKKEINTSAVKNIAKAAHLIAEEEDFIEFYSGMEFKNCLIKQEKNCVEFDCTKFNGLHSAMKKRLVRMAVEHVAKSVKDISFTHIENVIDIFGGKTGRSTTLPYNITAYRSYDRAVIEKKENKAEHRSFFYEIGENEVYVKEAGIYVEKSCKKPIGAVEYRCFDEEKCGEKFFVRSRQNGDKIDINKAEKTKKLKDIFIDSKLPRDERDKIAVIGCEKGLLWVYRYRNSVYFGADENTVKKIYIIVRRVSE